jgi:acylphosphatase
MTSRRRVVVHGRVQGVGFRASCARRARERALGGWVRNRPDGTVEAAFEGDEERVEEMSSWCREGPAMARVTRIELFEEQPVGERDFLVR